MRNKITTLLFAVVITTTTSESVTAESRDGKLQGSAGAASQLGTAGLQSSLKKVAEATSRKQKALNEKYLKALKRLKESYKSNDRLEDGLATLNEIHSVTSGEGEKATPIPPSATALLKTRQTYERERRKIQDLADVTYIRAVEKHLALLEREVKHGSGEAGATSKDSISRLKSAKAYKAALLRHKAYLALTTNSSATTKTQSRSKLPMPQSLASFR